MQPLSTNSFLPDFFTAVLYKHGNIKVLLLYISLQYEKGGFLRG